MVQIIMVQNAVLRAFETCLILYTNFRNLLYVIYNLINLQFKQSLLYIFFPCNCLYLAGSSKYVITKLVYLLQVLSSFFLMSVYYIGETKLKNVERAPKVLSKYKRYVTATLMINLSRKSRNESAEIQFTSLVKSYVKEQSFISELPSYFSLNIKKRGNKEKLLVRNKNKELL